MHKRALLFLEVILIAGIILSILIYSRFTVDDAFISWRYSKNLMEGGVWNYNGNIKDITNAHTNTLYALIALIPHYLGINVVLFFKIISSLLVFGGVVLTRRILNASFWPYIFFIIPGVILHSFSGLSTFLYAFLVFLSAVAYERGNQKQLLWCLSILIYVRPEGLLLAGVLGFWMILNSKQSMNYAKNALILSCVALSYFMFNYVLFNDLLPNTFYVKSEGEFNPQILYEGLPLLLLIVIIKKRFFLSPYFWYSFVVLLKYSFSDLTMNYSGRFLFQVGFPLILLSIFYLRGSTLLQRGLIVLQAFVVFSLFGGLNISYLTYYPRLLSAHAKLGVYLRNSDAINSFAVGDAGILPYHSSKDVLDVLGLGSKQLTSALSSYKKEEVMSLYNLDLIILYKAGDNITDKLFEGQEWLVHYIHENEFVHCHDLIWRENYCLAIYARPNLSLDFSGIQTNDNKLEDWPYIRQVMVWNPFAYWK